MADSNVNTKISLSSIPDNISVQFLSNHTNLSGKVLQKGLNYFTQGYVHDIQISRDENISKVVAKCWPSMRKNQPPHKLYIDVSSTQITEAFCSCKAGMSGHCSHIVGLIKSLQGLKLHNFTEVPEQQSCTSLPQQWHIPRGTKIKLVPINHVVVARPCESRKRKPIICQINTDAKLPKVTNELIHLSGLQGTPLTGRIFESTPTVTTPLGEVQIGSILSYQTLHLKKTSISDVVQRCGNISVTNTTPINLPEKFKHLNNDTKCEDPTDLEVQTRNQASSNLWHKERANRVTSSNFGYILNRKSAPSEKFLNKIFLKQQIFAKSLDYGKKHERIAKEKYLEVYPSRHFHECGLVVSNEFSFLGATPDAVVCDNGQSGIAEVKCPYSARNMTISEACSEIPDFYLLDENNNMHLKETHLYYAQVQGQLMITGCDFCEFIVYTSKDMHVQRILPDVPFMINMLNKLAEFYNVHALPHLSSTK